MSDIKAAVEKPRFVALYSSMTIQHYMLCEVFYRDHDEHYNRLPEGQKREAPLQGYVRVSEPVEVQFIAINQDEIVARAVESLNEEERKVIDELNQKLAQIREKRSQLLALTHEVAS